MNHRTNGETENCKGCRFWSELLAMAHGGPVKAMCLATYSEKRMTYQPGTSSCTSWASGYDGAIDEPGSDPARYESCDE